MPFRTFHLAWIPDGFVLIGSQEGEWGRPIWFVNYPGGEACRITSDMNLYSALAASADGRTIVAEQDSRHANIWVTEADNRRDARQVTPGRNAEDGLAGLAWTADGRVIYTSATDQGRHLWSVGADGGQPQQITFGQADDISPMVSADGRLVAFGSSGTDGAGIWCADVDGGNLRLAAKLEMGQLPGVLTQDVRFRIYFKDGNIWRVAVAGGSPEVLINKSQTNLLPPGFTFIPGMTSLGAAISPDGRYLTGQITWKGKTESGIVDLKGRDAWRPLKIGGGFRWHPDGRSLTYLAGPMDGKDVWAAPLDGGPASQLTAFKDVMAFAWSPDGRRLALARGQGTSDLVVLTDEGKK